LCEPLLEAFRAADLEAVEQRATPGVRRGAPLGRRHFRRRQGPRQGVQIHVQSGAGGKADLSCIDRQHVGQPPAQA
jgi:hypothetical protein